MDVGIAVGRDRIGSAPAYSTVSTLDYHASHSGLRTSRIDRVRVSRINCQRVDIGLGRNVVESAPASATISALEDAVGRQRVNNLGIAGSNGQLVEILKANYVPAHAAVRALIYTAGAGRIKCRRGFGVNHQCLNRGVG